jgi:DNA topoisomerase I
MFLVYPPRMREKRVCVPGRGGYRQPVARRGGWRRLGAKRFRYVTVSGEEVRDEEQLERIRALAIPPAWREVWISPNPRARIQATGVDAAGRKQYRYHASFRAAQDRAKFEQLLDFASALPDLRATTSRHLRHGEYERDWTCALAVGLVNKAWFRIGSDRHTRRSRTYGVTTLTKRHASVEGDEVQFCFRAKNRRLVRRTIRNATLAGGVARLLDLPGGGRLFRYERDGELVALTGNELNEYLAESMGDGFTAKDFRTWGGTLLAATQLARRGPSEDERESKRAIAAAMRSVGDELGNTAAVARESYVSPAVIDAYLDGRTLEDYHRASRRPARLSQDERALVRLLRAAAR